MTEDPVATGDGAVGMVIAHSQERGLSLAVGASVSVSGVCLTVTGLEPERFEVELSPETLARTTLGGLRRGSEVNLEPALRAGDPMGGHWVQGHADTTVEAVEVRQLGDHRVVAFELPPELGVHIVEKGSVALDGVSLTVSRRQRDRFEVALIPHTLEVTTLGRLQEGQRVNLEVDILAKYVYQALLERGLVRGGA